MISYNSAVSACEMGQHWEKRQKICSLAFQLEALHVLVEPLVHRLGSMANVMRPNPARLQVLVGVCNAAFCTAVFLFGCFFFC